MNQSYKGILLIAVAILGWFAIVRPQIDVFGDKVFKVSVLAQEEVSYRQRIENINQIKSKGDSFQTILTAHNLALPGEAQIPESLVMIEALAAKSGVAFSAASISQPANNEVPVSVSFGGDPGKVNSFLDKLHNNVRTVVVKDQSISTDQSGNLSVTMQLGLVYQGEKQ